MDVSNSDDNGNSETSQGLEEYRNRHKAAYEKRQKERQAATVTAPGSPSDRTITSTPSPAVTPVDTRPPLSSSRPAPPASFAGPPPSVSASDAWDDDEDAKLAARLQEEEYSTLGVGDTAATEAQELDEDGVRAPDAQFRETLLPSPTREQPTFAARAVESHEADRQRRAARHPERPVARPRVQNPPGGRSGSPVNISDGSVSPSNTPPPIRTRSSARMVPPPQPPIGRVVHSTTATANPPFPTGAVSRTVLPPLAVSPGVSAIAHYPQPSAAAASPSLHHSQVTTSWNTTAPTSGTTHIPMTSTTRYHQGVTSPSVSSLPTRQPPSGTYTYTSPSHSGSEFRSAPQMEAAPPSIPYFSTSPLVRSPTSTTRYVVNPATGGRAPITTQSSHPINMPSRVMPITPPHTHAPAFAPPVAPPVAPSLPTPTAPVRHEEAMDFTALQDDDEEAMLQVAIQQSLGTYGGRRVASGQEHDDISLDDEEAMIQAAIQQSLAER